MSYKGESGQHGSEEFRPFGSRPGALLSRDSLRVLNFLFKLGLARPAPSQPDSRHRHDGGGRQMNPSIQFDTGGDCNFRVLWEDGDRIFCRGHRRSADGDGVFPPATEHTLDPPASIVSLTNTA